MDVHKDAGIPIDRGWAWMCVLGCAVMHIFVVGIFKSIGVVFVEMLDVFKGSNAMTAWIPALLGALVSVFSPLANGLAVKYGSRPIVMLGGVLYAAGICLCYFANSMVFIICSYGIITGIGFAFAYGPSVVIVSQYFHKRRSLANGISVAGGSVGQFVVPPLCRYLLDEYAYSGAFLILGGLCLNVVVCGALYRPFTYYTKRKQTSAISDAKNENDNVRKCSKCQSMSNCHVKGEVEVCDKDRTNQTGSFVTKQQDTAGSEFNDDVAKQQLEHRNSVPCSGVVKKTLAKRQLSDGQKIERKTIADQNMIEHPEKNGFMTVAKRALSNNEDSVRATTSLIHLPVGSLQSLEFRPRVQSDAGSKAKYKPLPNSCIHGNKNGYLDNHHSSKKDLFHRGLKHLVEPKSNMYVSATSLCPVTVPQPITDNQECQDETWCEHCENAPRTKPALFDFGLLKNRLLMILLVAITLGQIGYTNQFLFIPAHAGQHNISQKDAAFLISVCGITDLVGRVAIGVFSDFKFVRVHYIMVVTMAISGIGSILAPYAVTYPTLIVYCSVYGFFGGSYIALIAVACVEFLGIERLSHAYGLLILTIGAGTLAGPPFLGWVSDQTGDYHWAFRVSGITMILGALVLLLEPCASRAERAKEAAKESEEKVTA